MATTENLYESLRTRSEEITLKNRAMDAAPIGITTADMCAEDEPLIYVNGGFERLTGYDAAAVLGRNLLKNAIQHNDRDEPRVTVTGRLVDGTVEIAVSDDGPGVPAEIADVLFEKGVRGRASETTGVGLYIVACLLENFGGAVRLGENQPRGSVFTVSLPVAE